MTDSAAVQAAALPPDVEAHVKATIACAMWLIARDWSALAQAMRDEFCREWQVDRDLWDGYITELIEYAERKGETPDITIGELREAAYGNV